MLTCCRSLLIASLFILGVASSTAFGATATQSGNWSNSDTWGGSPPSGNEEDVVIPMGITVTLDTSDEVGELRVMGKLTVAT
ncbi:G8 domain-containing protein, partial [bacterium]|nr:G8 domain-containing protein [bacterium]